MKNNFVKWGIRILGGVLLYILSLVQTWLNQMNLPQEMFLLVFNSFSILGVLIAIFITLYKNRTVCQSIASLITMVISWFSTLVINGYLGIVLWLENTLNLQSNSYLDNVSGLIMLMFAFLIITSSMIGIIIKTIYIKLIKYLNKNN